jgi:pimeloyl-ACP methyl ester carboxylesterase
MQRLRTAAAAVLLFLAIPAFGQSTCDPDGVQASGSIYRICMPPAGQYNGNLIIWAHGFQDAGTPVSIPEDQLCIQGQCLNQIANGLGNAFITNSYSKTGLAVVQGAADILDLVNVFTAAKGRPNKVFLVGASEGGIITTLNLERHPDVFSAGLALCGPIGSFPMQINYFGDARATFEYFYPGIIPGDPFNPDPWLVSNWSLIYDMFVKPIIMAPQTRPLLEQWVAVAGLPYDPANYEASVEQSVRDVLRYSVVNLADAAATLGGFPYDNTAKWYTGSNDDFALNYNVRRLTADPAALSAMAANYETSGALQRPLITMHTSRDQQVPALHQVLYMTKTAASGNLLSRHLPVLIDRYEHCNFTPDEVISAFTIMILYAGLFP